MTKRLTPYGLAEYADTVSMVGKTKAAQRLAARMPSPEVFAKVGAVGDGKQLAQRTQRVVRRHAQTVRED